MKQGFGLLEHLYSEFGPAAVKLVDKDDGSFGYLGQMALYELANFAPKLFFRFVLFEKIGAAEIFNDAINVNAVSNNGGGGFYDANDSLAKSFPPLTLCSSTALAIEANIGKIGLSKWSSSHALK